jgi:hypothetical protein
LDSILDSESKIIAVVAELYLEKDIIAVEGNTKIHI